MSVILSPQGHKA
ncbi:rCG48434 [Rattus norvegicus]|uniref:RCG48434 n=1 Tax=Rattus norvegicus TaxID=10116 RepID=A6HZW0_RAT|nr:rCG48434 [Rattus norvegicus]